MQNLESMKAELAVTEKQLEDWVRDVNEWAESEDNLNDVFQLFCSHDLSIYFTFSELVITLY